MPTSCHEPRYRAGIISQGRKLRGSGDTRGGGKQESQSLGLARDSSLVGGGGGYFPVHARRKMQRDSSSVSSPATSLDLCAAGEHDDIAELLFLKREERQVRGKCGSKVKQTKKVFIDLWG